MRSGLPLTLGAVGALAVAAALSRSGSRAFGRDGHWGRAGAGVLLTTGQRVLVLLRSEEVTEPGTWNLAGGAVDPGEDALTAGLRELEEETGLAVDPDDAHVVGNTVWQSPTSSFRYTTSVVRVPESWTRKQIQLNWENDEALWVDAAWLEAHRAELHPGLRAALPELMRLAFGGAGSRATVRPPAAFRDLAAWTAWARTEGVELRLAKTPSYTVEITDLFADTTGTGAGTRVMQALAKAADKAGMPLTLHPSSRRNVTFYERFGFVVTGRDGMMRREPKRGSRATTTAPVVLYHGAQRWEGAPEIVAHRKGHAEHGPGIYLTTSHETAARYAKGGGSVYRMELRPGVRWLQDAKLDKEPVLRWLKGLARLRGKEKLVAGVERVTARTGDTFPAEILVNQFVNEGASSGQHGPALAAFLVENGVDASLTSPPMFGGTGGAHGEDWVVVFNPDILRSVTKVTAREVGKQAPFDLPRVTR